MNRTVWAVIGLVTLNLTLPAVAVQMAQNGYNPFSLIAVNAVAVFVALTLAALDPNGSIRREIDAPDQVVVQAPPSAEVSVTPAPAPAPAAVQSATQETQHAS